MFFFHDFAGFFFLLYSVCLCSFSFCLMQLARCLYVRDYFDDTFICSKLKILFL